MTSKIQNKRAIIQVLGYILKDPEVLLRSDFKLEQSDFPETIHNIIFTSVVQLLRGGVTKLDGVTIDNFLADKPLQYKIFKDNGGIELIEKMKCYSNEAAIDYWYSTLKKYSLLRSLKDEGFDISTYYDTTLTNINKIEEMQQKLDNVSVEDIIHTTEKKIINIKEKMGSRITDKTEFLGGDGLDELLDSLGNTEQYGHTFINPYFTEAFMGMRKSKFLMVSGDSGSGKSRTQIANAVHVALPYLYDLKEDSWIMFEEEPEPVLYISTELSKRAIQLVFLAYVTGIEENRIKRGTINQEEKKRLNIASILLKNAPLYCRCIDDFDIQDVETIIEKTIIQHKIGYVFHDYLHTTPKLMGYYNKITGVKMQEHQILYLFGNSLKQLTNKYNIHIYTSSQLNRSAEDGQQLNSNSLRGAKGLGDKLDGGVISTAPTAKDLKMIEDIINTKGVVTPNMCHTIYKNRDGEYTRIKIWTIINLGNIREEVLFVTDENYRLIEMTGAYPPTLKVENPLIVNV